MAWIIVSLFPLLGSWRPEQIQDVDSMQLSRFPFLDPLTADGEDAKAFSGYL